MTAERDALRQEVIGVTNALGIQLEVSRRNRDRIAALEAALRKYGRHERDLPHPCMYPDGDCTCGLDAALAGGGR